MRSVRDRMARGVASPPRTAALAAAGATALAVVPLVYLAAQATDAGWSRVGEIVLREQVLELAGRSLALALLVGVVAGALGTAGAWIVERTDLRHPGFWHVLAVMPLAVPSYVSGYVWVSWWPAAAGFWGAAGVLILTTTPLVHLSVTALLRGLDGAQEEAARAAGCTPLQVLRRVTLPQARRGIAAGALLASLYVLADFGAVAIMRVPVLTWVILGAYRSGFDPSRAAVLAGVLALLALCVVAAEGAVRGRSSVATVGRVAARPAPRVALGRARWFVAAAFVAVAGLAVGFPIGSYVAWWSQGGSEVERAEFLEALGTTVALGATVAAVAIAVVLPLAWSAARYGSTAARTAERAVMAAHGLPGIVVALSFVSLGVRALTPIYQRWPLVVLAQVALTASLALGGLRSAFERHPVGLTDAGRACGRSRGAVFLRVTLPLSWPQIAAAFAVVALTTAKELPSLLLLRPAGTDTLATRLWTWAGVSDHASVAPYAIALVGFSVVPALVAATAGRSRRSLHASGRAAEGIGSR